MKTTRTLFVAGGLSAMLLAAALAQAVDFHPLIVANPRGTMHLQQSVPCDHLVELTTDVAGGRIEMTPARGIDLEGGDKIFNLTRLTLFFNPFTVDGECRGIRDPHRVSAIGVQLTSSAFLRASPAGQSDIYRVRIPKEQFLIYESIVDNGVLKTHYAKPTEDVTGNVSLDRQTMDLHIVVATRVLFRAGCDSRGRCVIDEVRDGTQTADIAGAIVFPATTPPR